MTDETFSAANWLRAIRATEGQGPLALARSLVFDTSATVGVTTAPPRSHLRLIVDNSPTATHLEGRQQ